MKRIALTSACVLLGVSALAEDLTAPKEIKDLGWMIGTWSAETKIKFGAKETKIASSMIVSYDGMFLKAVATDKSDDFTLTKTTMTSWDAAQSQYVSYAFTNIAPTARIARGTMIEGKLVLTSDPWEAEGMKTAIRETMWKVSEKKIGLKMEMQVKDKWVTGMDLVMTKK
ncbi:MAG: hypothetical protein JNM85_09815 [Chthonomonas sp.]|nr:hypothetical protein [Chthonomonas sp.]